MYACAQTTPLTGGPKDVWAPAIDSAKTYPANGQINFDGNEVSIKFNEYIRLNNPTENIIIIPQQTEAPTIMAKNKRLNIKFNEPLTENTTYTITFNNAIQDITEKNDSVFQFVFSTGNYIDSLQVFGSVKDAFTNQAAAEMLVGLYPKNVESNFDSIPFKYKPTYLSQTNDNGLFQLNYLKAGVYYLFAIKDKNKNLLYDKGEYIGFIAEKEFNLIPTDTFIFDFGTFVEEDEEVYVEDVNFTFPGKLEVILSNPTDSFSVSSTMSLLEEKTAREDSLIFWLTENPQARMKFFTNLLGEKDTLKPIFKGTPDNVNEVKLTQTNNVVKGKLLPNENLKISFSEPILNVDLSGIHFYDIDSNELDLKEYNIDVRTIEFETEGSDAVRILIDSAAVSSVFGRVFSQSLALNFENHSADYYGSLIVSMDTTFSVPVIVHVLDDKKQIVASQPFQKKMVFEKLLPANYQLRLIFDVDDNGEWTPGSLSEGRIPEKVIYNTESIKVKSKWEKEIEWQLIPN